MTISAKARTALKRALYTSPNSATEIADAIDGLSGSNTAQRARFASTANLNLATTGLTAIDGVTPVAGDVALVKNQSTASQNGLYVAAVGAWVRLKDGAGHAIALVEGLVVSVAEGTANAETQWNLDADLTTWTEIAASAATPSAVAAAAAVGTSKLFARGDHAHADPNRAAAGAALGDADAPLIMSGGTWRKIPATTLTADRTYTLGTTGAAAGDQIDVTRLDATAHAAIFVNGGAGAGTLLTMPNSKVNFALFQFDGTNWALRRCGTQ